MGWATSPRQWSSCAGRPQPARSSRPTPSPSSTARPCCAAAAWSSPRKGAIMSTTADSHGGLEFIQVKYGERVTRKGLVLDDYAAYGEPDGDLHMEYNFWVMRDGDTVMLLD